MHRRKDEDASPYINHPIALMKVLCIEAGVRDPTILRELESEFGSEIASIVSELTDDKLLPKAERKRLQIEIIPASLMY
jgi:guanosine-3',5'-bis(diphosphate) 3'-pyrophosphohydrolase